MGPGELQELYGDMQFRDFVNEAILYEADITETLFLQELMEGEMPDKQRESLRESYESIDRESLAQALFQSQRATEEFQLAAEFKEAQALAAQMEEAERQEMQAELAELRQEKLREVSLFVKNTVEEVKNMAVNGAHGVMQKLKEIPFAEKWQQFIQFGGKVIDLAKGKVEELTPALKEAITKGGETVKGAIEKTLPSVVSVGKKAAEVGKEAVVKGAEFGKGLVAKGWPALAAMGGAALAGGKKALEAALPAVKSAVEQGAQTAQEVAAKVMENAIPIMENAASLAKEVAPVITKLPGALLEGARAVGMVSGAVARETAAGLYQAGSAAFEAALPVMQEILQGITEAGSAAFEAAAPTVEAVIEGIVEVATQLPGALAEAVAALVPE